MQKNSLAFVEPRPADAFRQAPRRPVAMPVRLSSSAMKPLRAQVSNISRMGCRLEVRCRFAPGIRLLVTFPSLAPLSAQVIWSRERQAGVQFSRAIAAGLLDQLIDRYPPAPSFVECRPLWAWRDL